MVTAGELKMDTTVAGTPAALLTIDLTTKNSVNMNGGIMVTFPYWNPGAAVTTYPQ